MTDDELRALIERECGPVRRISDMLWAVEVARVAMAAERERCAKLCDEREAWEDLNPAEARQMMNDAELAAAVHQHMGRLDAPLLQYALDLARAVRDAERERCVSLCVANSERWDAIGGDGGASLECADAIRKAERLRYAGDHGHDTAR